MKSNVENYKLDLENIALSHPKNIDALIRLGVLEFEYFHNHEKALQIEPSSVDARFWLAACLYYDFAEYEKAEPYVKEALQLDPDRPECLCLRASIIYGTHQPILTALQYVEKALHLAPNWPALRYQFYSHPRQMCWEFDLETALEILVQAKKMMINLDVKRDKFPQNN
jgi:tetratricopeptide (TPR) repeat protein